MEEILKIAGSLAVRAVGLVAMWAGAKTPEEREQIRVNAERAVLALDPHFAEKDAEDKAKQDALRADIEAAKP